MRLPSHPVHPTVLATTQWLAEHLDDDSIRIIEVGLDPAPYEEGHIEGAVWWPGLGSLMNDDYSYRFEPEQVGQLMADAGIAEATTVVVYSEHPALGPWVYWYLRSFGHQQVRVLDGGRPKWVAEGRALTTEVVAPTAVEARAVTLDSKWRATTDDVLALAETSSAVLLDVRTGEEYSGELFLLAPPEPGERAGHIPGAAYLYYEEAMADDGTFRSTDELTALYDSLGATADRPVVTYCAVGMRSAHTWFVLSELLGHPDVRSYSSSWNEWGRRTDTPIEGRA